jgi:hypothetical protein
MSNCGTIHVSWTRPRPVNYVRTEYLVPVDFSRMTLTLKPCPLPHREKAGVRGLVRCHHFSLTLTLSQRERGRKSYLRERVGALLSEAWP